MIDHETDFLIIGAGPAGLTAAWELSKHKKTAIILESDNVVGGISRTVEKDGWRFDIGGHRFFSKSEEVNAIWDEILPKDDFLIRPRLSRIYYKQKFFNYPLKALNALTNLGVIEAFRCVLSYLITKLNPPKDQTNFEGWVAARFGWRLYNIFFKTYTEKVWGIPANQIGSDWASQRIKNFSLATAIIRSILPNKKDEIVTTLIDEFKYPKFGPGMMWETAQKKLDLTGTKTVFGAKVTSIEFLKPENLYKVTTDNDHKYITKYVFTSMPLALLPKTISPQANDYVKKAGLALKFRDFLSVALVVPKENAFPDNWIYIHDSNVNVGRIQNYGRWSPYLVKDNLTCLGLEYFVDEGDEMWMKNDEELIELATKELIKLNLINESDIKKGFVVKMPKAYPIYDLEYKENILEIANWLKSDHPNIYPIGRNGMHRYNNQDHSMLTAVSSVRNILLNEDTDIWGINMEDEYHEENKSSRMVPIQK